MTGTGVVTISVYNGLTRNWEIGNTPACVLPNILRLGRVRNTKFCMNVSNEMLLNAAKCQDYSFYRFWVIKRKPTGLGWEGSNFKPTQVRVNVFIVDLTLIRCLPNWLSFTRSRVNGLTNFMPLVSFYASWRYHKSSGFPFSGGKESSVTWNGLRQRSTVGLFSYRFSNYPNLLCSGSTTPSSIKSWSSKVPP